MGKRESQRMGFALFHSLHPRFPCARTGFRASMRGPRFNAARGFASVYKIRKTVYHDGKGDVARRLCDEDRGRNVYRARGREAGFARDDRNAGGDRLRRGGAVGVVRAHAGMRSCDPARKRLGGAGRPRAALGGACGHRTRDRGAPCDSVSPDHALLPEGADSVRTLGRAGCGIFPRGAGASGRGDRPALPQSRLRHGGRDSLRGADFGRRAGIML